MVHRDMKPENVMIESREGEDFAKVLDFGIAKVMSGDRQAPALTAFGQTLGTLEFMSPEQLRGQKLDGRSDIYALGMMAYEMLTGKLPFPSAKTPIDIINFHMKHEAPPPSRLGATIAIPGRGGRDHPQDGAEGPRAPLRRRQRPARGDRPRAALARPHAATNSSSTPGRRQSAASVHRRRALAYFLPADRRRSMRDARRFSGVDVTRASRSGLAPSNAQRSDRGLPRQAAELTRSADDGEEAAPADGLDPGDGSQGFELPRDHQMISARPLMRFMLTVPHLRESYELSRLSPITNTSPAGTTSRG